MTTTVALFHSVLGIDEGILLASERLQAAGYSVHIVDQYEGRVFDDYPEADEFAQSLGFPFLMQRALDAVADLPDGFAAMGFSNGGGMATYVACNRHVERLVLCSAALPLHMLSIQHWPTGMPVQVHYTLNDPFKMEGQSNPSCDRRMKPGRSPSTSSTPVQGIYSPTPHVPRSSTPIRLRCCGIASQRSSDPGTPGHVQIPHPSDITDES